MSNPVLALFTCLALSVTSLAQDMDPLDAELGSWRESNGPAWRVDVDGGTGFARFLYGGRSPLEARPSTEDEWITRALEFVDMAQPLLGIEPETLVFDELLVLPLSQMGSTDKMTARFEQRIGEVAVERGSVNVLMDMDGRLLALDSLALPWVAGLGVEPTIPAASAIEAARQHFADEAGRVAKLVGSPELVVAQEWVGEARIASLSWKLELFAEAPGSPPLGRAYLMGAQGFERVIEQRSTVHNFDVSGTAWTLATPGTKPDTPANPPVPFPAAHMQLTSSAGNVVTDANGNFNFPGVTTPLDVTFAYTGPFVDVVSFGAGAEHTLTVQLQPGAANQVTLNAAGLSFDTNQANAFVATNALRDWLRDLNPGDATADFVNYSRVNFFLASCNAAYDGASTTYYDGSAGCVNAAYSSIIAHESGHWLNDRYHSGNGPDGFGEGNADVFGMYLYDSPYHAEDFTCTGPGCEGRSGLNMRPFCGDANPGCYGELHVDGEVLMGALWKVRAALNTSLGDAPGDLASDLLFSSWMNAYDDGEIKTIIRTHWLTLDDNDGNLDNGTPHFADIEAGFVAQGFPPFPLATVGITDVTELVDTRDEAGPFGVQALVTPIVGSSILTAELHYSVGGGAPQLLPMTHAGADIWRAMLPGSPAPTKVEYWVSAMDDLGNTSNYPLTGGLAPLDFLVGEPVVLFADDFEGAGLGGWTHNAIAGVDDWEKGQPFGDSGTTFWGGPWVAPSAAASGTNVFATDLGQDGEASYAPNAKSYLRSPTIDASSAQYSTLVFQRWLTVERNTWDMAQLFANGSPLWSNPGNFEVLDDAWQSIVLDVAAFADGNPSVEFEWRLLSNGGGNLGGWALDDVELHSLGPVLQTCALTPYGVGLTGSLGVPTIDTAGQQATIGNASFEIALKGAMPESPAFVSVGTQATSIPLFGGSLLLVPFQTKLGTTDGFGQAHIAFPIPAIPSLAGIPLHFQAAVLDLGAPQGFALTAGLMGQLCP